MQCGKGRTLFPGWGGVRFLTGQSCLEQLEARGGKAEKFRRRLEVVSVTSPLRGWLSSASVLGTESYSGCIWFVEVDQGGLYLALKEEQYLSGGGGGRKNSREISIRVCGVAVHVSCGGMWRDERWHWMLTGGKVEKSMGSDSSGSALEVWGRVVLQRARLGSRARARQGGNHSSD